MIEMDEGYFTIEASQHDHPPQKASRGGKTKSIVMVMAESIVLENIDTGKVERHCRYFKAKVLEDHKSEETNNTLKNAINDEQIIVSKDQSTSLSQIM